MNTEGKLTQREILRELDLMMLEFELPVAQIAPPSIARGQNFGLLKMIFTIKDTVHIAAQRTHWKNMPKTHTHTVYVH